MMTLNALRAKFPTEDSCKAYIATMRWPVGVSCPQCGDDEKIYKLSKPWSWVCKGIAHKSAYRFSVTTGTIFENTKAPLRDWFMVILIMCGAKKGISAMQIQRITGCASYETAWYMCHRIRAAMDNPEFRRLTGQVE